VPPGGSSGNYLSCVPGSLYNSAWTTFPSIGTIGTKISLGGGTTGGAFPFKEGIYIGYNTGGASGSGGGTQSLVIGNSAGQTLTSFSQNNIIIGDGVANEPTGLSNSVLIGTSPLGNSLTTESGVTILGKHPGKPGTNDLTIIGSSAGFVSLNTSTGGVGFNNYNTGAVGQQLYSMGPDAAPAWRDRSYAYAILTQDIVVDSRFAVQWSQVSYRGTNITSGGTNTYLRFEPNRTYKITVNLGAFDFSNQDGFAIFIFGTDDNPVVPCAKAILFANNRNSGESLVSSFSSIFISGPSRNTDYRLKCSSSSGQLTLRGGYCQLIVEDF
jgi:hypothetical protein